MTKHFSVAVGNEFRQQMQSLAGNCSGDESSRMAPSPSTGKLITLNQ